MPAPSQWVCLLLAARVAGKCGIVNPLAIAMFSYRFG